ncbi:MAG: sulfite exporter TauE/SafE family protein [Syntrophaceae bacterium]|nr:sulfite exporter TauE/SafE family protein [Syntrophaceae bacterium]
MDNLISLFLGPVHLPVFFGLFAVTFSGALITSGFGVGGGMLMTPLVLLLLPPKFGIGLIGPMMLLMAGAGVRQYWRQWDLHCLLVLLPAMTAGIWVGTHLLSVVSADTVRRTVGALALGFGILQYLAIDRPLWKERLRPTPPQGVGLGFASGIISALAHVGGIIFSFYLIPHSRTKEAFAGTTVFLFFTTGLLKIGSYVYYHILTFPILMLCIALLPALVLGSIFGKRLNRGISNKLFIRLICIFVGLMGVWLVLN